jgi:hypothetical protein
MAWVRLDDGFYDHPKARAVGKDGRELFTAGLCRVAETLSDGFIPEFELPLIAAKAEVKPKPTAAKLVSVGLWEKVTGGWRVHDYHDYNPSAEAEREKRRKRAEAGRKGGLRSRPPGRSAQATREANASAIAPPNAQAIGEAESKQIGTPSPSPLFSKFSVPSSSTDGGGASDDDDRQAFRDLLTAAARILGEADHEQALDDGVDIRSRSAHLRECVRRRTEEDPRLADLVRRNPDLTAAQIAELATDASPLAAPVAPPPAAGDRALGLVTVAPITDPDCPRCDGMGVYFVDGAGNTTHECDCKYRSAS